MPNDASLNYAVIRVVPRVERQEFVNVGVILFCKERRYLDVALDHGLHRLRALAPDCDFEMIQEHLRTIAAICRGGPGAGRFAEWSQSERFHWLTGPSSTVIQYSPVHAGLCADPAEELARLYDLFVR
jgi:hypothetical protein